MIDITLFKFYCQKSIFHPLFITSVTSSQPCFTMVMITKILLPCEDNGERLMAKATIKWLKPLKRTMGKGSKTSVTILARPSKAPNPNRKSAHKMSLMNGRLGRRPTNLPQFKQQMIQSHVNLMPREMAFHILMVW